MEALETGELKPYFLTTKGSAIVNIHVNVEYNVLQVCIYRYTESTLALSFSANPA